MKSKFPAYHRIHRDDLLARFDDCIFMFDACALLDIYRMKREVTDDVFNVMEHLKDQIRIPYHVAEEYFDNIHEVLNTQINNIKSSRTDFNKFIQTLETKRSQPYISKKTTELLGKLKVQVEKDFKQQEEYVKDQLIHGEYQNRVNNLLEGKVLEPFTKEELAEIEKEGERRRENKIPPGYKDANKSSNRCGDLINWKEILRFAKESGKCIVIVSSEQKEDWVLREQGCVICLRYELLEEFYETVGNQDQLIHFLSLDLFLELAREKDARVVSEATVNEVKDYVTLPVDSFLSFPYETLKMPIIEIPEYSRLVPSGLEAQIESWRKLQEQLDPKFLRGYQDLIARMGKVAMPFRSISQKASKVDMKVESIEENNIPTKGREEDTPKEKCSEDEETSRDYNEKEQE